MRRFTSLALVTLALLVAGNAFAIGQARITGKVTDAATKKGIPDAVITVTALEGKTFKEKFTVKKDGSYAIFLLDGTIRYEFEYGAPGYQSRKDEKKLKLAEPNVDDVSLVPAGMTTAVVPGGEIKIDPTVSAYNEGAALANEGKDAEAIAKFEEALATKPDLTAGWQALAKVAARSKQWDKAINAANKAIELMVDELDIYAVLYEAYTAKGDKVKAAEYKGKLPANPGALFNDAARAINAGKDSDAEPLLKQAIAADEKFGQAYYELGMLYVRSGKTADARANLEKYIEVDPTGKDVATAKEMLKYVQ